MNYLKLTPEKLSVDTISQLVINDSCGAVSIFVGTTRDNFENKKVLRLEYEAYEPMALKAMKGICDDIRKLWPAVHSIAIYHRLGIVPCREASIVIAVSSPHRRDSLDAVSHCIEKVKSDVTIWKKEVYENDAPAWKENVEYKESKPTLPQYPIDKKLVQINVSNEELEQRIQLFINRKREQVNISNIHDFIPNKSESETEETETCARVRTQFVKRSDSKGHLKIKKVHNEWGPQTVPITAFRKRETAGTGLPLPIAERVLAIENYLNISPVSPDIYKRLKEMEDKIAYLQSVSPEYSHFLKKELNNEEEQPKTCEYMFSADDIAKKIELLEKHENL